MDGSPVGVPPPAPAGLAAPSPVGPSSRGDVRPPSGSGDPSEDLADALRRALSGDRGGFVLLYRSLQPQLHRYARALVGQDADDVTGEAWLQIARDLPTFFGDLDGFRGWAASITRHRAMDLLRSRARQRAEPRGLQEPTRLADLTTAGDTADVAIATLHTEQALEMIASLPRDQAEAVLLRAVVGLSAAAAGEVLGKRAGAVRVAAHRGLRRLAAEIASADRQGEGA